MFALVHVWSEKKQDFLASSTNIELLKSIYPEVNDWKPNMVGGVTSKKTNLVIKEI